MLNLYLPHSMKYYWCIIVVLIFKTSVFQLKAHHFLHCVCIMNPFTACVPYITCHLMLHSTLLQSWPLATLTSV